MNARGDRAVLRAFRQHYPGIEISSFSGIRVEGAAMDVGRAADQKPSPRLARLPNVIATPHVGGQTPAAIQSQALETVAQVRAVSKGVLPHNAINPDQAFRFADFVGRRAQAAGP